MRGLLFIATQAFVLARSYTPPTCSECVATKGMTWKVDHKGAYVNVKCVPTEECKEVTTKAQTVMCFAYNCGKMPDTEGEKWWYEGTFFDLRCNTDSPIIACRSRNECAWVQSDEDPHCMFEAFAKQFDNITIICPRQGEKSEGLLLIEETVQPAEEPTIEKVAGPVPRTCDECAATDGQYSWRIILDSEKGMASGFSTSCVPYQMCEEGTTISRTVLCYSDCSMHPTREIDDWKEEHIFRKYYQCSSYLATKDCGLDSECAYIAENSLSGYCLFKQFADKLHVKDYCT